MDRAPFGRLLREYRLAKGLTQEALAERAAMSVNGISALERGANQAPQRKTLELLVDALSLDADGQRALEEAAARPARPQHAKRAVRQDLPAELSPFFGRERAIAAVSELVMRLPLVTLTGTGGVGKTRLALKIAERLAHRFKDGVEFLDLARLRDPQLATAAFNELVDRMHGNDALLVIDNCEHVAEAIAKEVGALVAECPGWTILATSRQPLELPGEQIFRVPALELDAAVELFVERANRSGKTVEFSSGERDAIARIAMRLDGIALAIELAAARINLLSLEQLESALTERLHILSGGSSMLLPRQQTMRATLDWSYELLGEAERQLFARLWIFPGRFSLDAALSICVADPSRKWQTFEALASLVDRSLVESSPEHGVQRYRLLETTRAYAAELVTDAADTEDVRVRHAAFYCALAEEAASALPGAESTVEWALGLEPDLENFRGALEWTLEQNGDVVAGARLIANLQEFWIVHGMAEEIARRGRNALDRNVDLPQTLRAGIWLTVARMRQELFVHPGETLEAATRARELYEEGGDRGGLALAIRQQAAAHMRLGEYARSREEFEHSLAIYRELDDRRMVWRGLGYLASLQQVQGEFRLARDTLVEVLATARSYGDDRMIPTVAVNLAETEFALGDYAAAVDRAFENLKDDGLERMPDMRATQRANLAVYLLACGRPVEARDMALASIDEADGSFIAVPLQHFAASIARMDPKRAATILGYVDKTFSATAFSRENTERFSYEYLDEALREAFDDETLERYRRDGANRNGRQILELAREL